MLMFDETDTRLEADFETLRQQLRYPDTLNPARGDPIFYFVYPPSRILTVRRLLPGWIAHLRNQDNLEVEVLSLSDVMWELIDASGRWETWVEAESEFELQDFKAAGLDVLCKNNDLAKQVEKRVKTPRDNTVLFIVDIELLHPFCRSRVIESHLNNKVQVPIVFFYPGERLGQNDLKFLGFYPIDSGYRSPIFGGQA
jgi:hypothetical protein